jgi:hypothetical protein
MLKEMYMMFRLIMGELHVSMSKYKEQSKSITIIKKTQSI